MSNRRTFVTDILGRYHDRPSSPAAADHRLSTRDYEYLCRAGLGPIAYQVLVGPGKEPVSEAHKMLLSADLTTRVLYKESYVAVAELLTESAAQDISVVLLKGISISAALYEPPHHRVMGDIDILVAENDVPKIHAILRAIGYGPRSRGRSPRLSEHHHHLPEVVHPTTGISIEVHSALMSRTGIAEEPIFQPSAFMTQLQESDFAGCPCARFSPEYQFVYTIGHWAIDLKWAINVISINDILHIVLRSGRDLHWDVIAGWMTENPMTADCITVIMSYLANCELIDLPEELKEQLRIATARIGSLNLCVLHWLLHAFPMSGSERITRMIPISVARKFWLTLLEPRSRYLRLAVAIWRIFFRRKPGKLSN